MPDNLICIKIKLSLQIHFKINLSCRMLWTETDKDTLLPSLLKRLEARVRETGESEAQFARRLGSSDALFKNMRKGSFPSVERLHALLCEIGETLVVGAPTSFPEPPDDLVHLPLHSAELSAGHGSNNEDEHIADYLAFKISWLRRMGIAPQNAVLARVRGNSMSPTITDRDIVLIDTSRREIARENNDPRSGRPRVYALLVEGEARIKRVTQIEDNLVGILSDNLEFGPEFRGTHDPDELRIIGRVMWWGHTESLP